MIVTVIEGREGAFDDRGTCLSVSLISDFDIRKLPELYGIDLSIDGEVGKSRVGKTPLENIGKLFDG